MTPAEKLRAAADAERREWGSELHRRMYPRSSAIHLAVADLLDAVADDAGFQGTGHEAKALAVADQILRADGQLP